MWFCLERFPLPLGALDGLRYFIVALPEPSIKLLSFLLMSGLCVVNGTHSFFYKVIRIAVKVPSIRIALSIGV